MFGDLLGDVLGMSHAILRAPDEHSVKFSHRHVMMFPNDQHIVGKGSTTNQYTSLASGLFIIPQLKPNFANFAMIWLYRILSRHCWTSHDHSLWVKLVIQIMLVTSAYAAEILLLHHFDRLRHVIP